MTMSEAIAYVDKKAKELNLRDEWGDLMYPEEVMAQAVPRGMYDELKQEFERGLMTPETFISWNMAFLDAYVRKRQRKRTERFLNSIQNKIPNAGSVGP